MSAPTAAEMLAEFHAIFTHPNTDSLWLRATLHKEEHEELVEALDDAQAAKDEDEFAARMPQVARELADVVYVAYGTALLYGVDLDAALREVHRANLSKQLGDDGKVLKGPNFTPPDMRAALKGGDGG